MEGWHRAAWPKGVGAPAQRAMAAAGITTFEALSAWSEDEIACLHGIGPKALGLLRVELRLRGLDFAPPAGRGAHPWP